MSVCAKGRKEGRKRERARMVRGAVAYIGRVSSTKGTKAFRFGLTRAGQPEKMGRRLGMWILWPLKLARRCERSSWPIVGRWRAR